MGVLPENDMAGLLAADHEVILLHVLVNIAVAHGGLFIADARLVQCLVQTEVAHNGSDQRIAGKLATLLEVLGADIHDLIAVQHLAPLVYGKAAVRVAVKGEAHVQMMLPDVELQALNVGGAAVRVDVHAVRLIVDDIGLGPQRVKHRPADHPGAAVGAVQTNLVLFKGPGGQAGEVADIAVAAGVEIDGLAYLSLGGPGEVSGITVDECFQLCLKGIVHLLAHAVHQLDAVVIKRIVAGGDHHAAVEILRTGDVTDAGSGGNVEQICVRAGGGDTRRQSVFKHIGGTPGVLADHDAGGVLRVLPAVIPAQKTAHLEGVLRRQINAGLAPETVCTKIFTHQNNKLLCLLI